MPNVDTGRDPPGEAAAGCRYLDRRSMRLDVQILVRTVRTVLG